MTGIITKAIWEILKGLLFKVAWKVVLERFMSRLVVYLLRKLAAMTSNALVQDTVTDIIKQLSHPNNRLPKIEEQDRVMQAAGPSR